MEGGLQQIPNANSSLDKNEQHLLPQHFDQRNILLGVFLRNVIKVLHFEQIHFHNSKVTFLFAKIRLGNQYCLFVNIFNVRLNRNFQFCLYLFSIRKKISHLEGGLLKKDSSIVSECKWFIVTRTHSIYFQ